ncbi:response regulator [Reyranella sp.]|uniref:response regulator n=1 Tax=Reyranella sp. TaxID=1929291 RepID=UPI00121F9D49|nr:response regulator [Reyranella sp.]TAJ85393.1 MAG: response regulator [Reyranella sp.]
MSLANTRVLVVEDEVLILLTLQAMLEDLGCTVVGTAHSLGDGMAMASTLAFDVAIVDMNLANERAQPIIEEVARRQISVIVTSGYDAMRSLEHFKGRASFTILPKPYTFDELSSALSAASAGTP